MIIYSFVCQYSLHYYWYCYNQKQSSGAVLQNCSYKFHKIHKKTPEKRFRHKCFLVNSAKFPIASFSENSLDGCFRINIRYVYCPTLTFCLFKDVVTHIFSLNIFSFLFVGWGQEWAQYFKLLARSLYSTQSNICDWVFFAKNSLQLKTVKYFREKAPLWCSTRF